MRSWGTVSAADGAKVLRSRVAETDVDVAGENGIDKEWNIRIIPKL